MRQTQSVVKALVCWILWPKYASQPKVCYNSWHSLVSGRALASEFAFQYVRLRLSRAYEVTRNVLVAWCSTALPSSFSFHELLVHESNTYLALAGYFCCRHPRALFAARFPANHCKGPSCLAPLGSPSNGTRQPAVNKTGVLIAISQYLYEAMRRPSVRQGELR